MTSHQLLFGVFIFAMLWALVIFVVITRAEIPAGMHRASIVRVDTVMLPHVTPVTRALDSMDSLWRARWLK